MRKHLLGATVFLILLICQGRNLLFAQTEYRLYGTSTYSGGSIFSLNSTGTDLLTHKIFAANGNGPVGSLVESSGRLYGMTSGGGSFNAGTIYSVNSDGTDFELIHEFNSIDGSQPENGLTLAVDGMLYGVTSRGGSFNNGIAFRINTDGTGFEKIHDFLSSAGKTPVGKLMQASDGNFYGLTSEGGDFQKGTIFKIDQATFAYTLLYEFNGNVNLAELDHDNTGGAEPHGALIEGLDGKLYGMTFAGGTEGLGSIFSIEKSGSNYTSTHSFSGTDGSSPLGDLVQDTNGDLYGMTSAGGANSSGVIFKISADGSTYETLLDLNPALVPSSSGISPDGSMILEDNFLYGVAKGGNTNNGAIFKLSTDGLSFTVLYSIAGDSRFDLTGSLAMDGDGNFYGLKAPSGDLHTDVGSIYKLDIQTLQLTTEYTFVLPDGSVPVSRMVQGPDLRLYGTAVAGGANGVGAIYSITTTGDDFQLVHSFQESEGKFVYGGLIPIADGYFAGTTAFGGTFLNGVVYKIKYDGTNFTKLHDFKADEGSGLLGRLALGDDGMLYGVSNGGANGHGTVFRVGQDGSDFEIIHVMNGTDGSTPRGGLMTASNDAFYGVTSAGGANGDGVIFKVDMTGTYTMLFEFNGINGTVPYGDLIEAADGKLYGMTSDSENGSGVIYRINNDGSDFTILHEFTDNEGGHPLGALTQAPTGEFYAMATADGQFGTGYIFRLEQDGTGFQKLADLNFINGNPESCLSVVPLATQSIDFDAIPEKTVGDVDFNLEATATSALPVTFTSSDTNVATVDGDVVTIVGAGTTTITARQNGNVFYSTATATQELVVKKKTQTITFDVLTAKTFGDAPFDLTATASSGLAVSLASDNEDVATISGNTVTIKGAGTANITASQAGDSEYKIATPVIQELTVNKASQIITFGTLPNKTFGAAPFLLVATTPSALAISFESDNEDVATVSGNTVTIVGVGTANITAKQPGNDNYLAATPVVRPLTVDKASQTITFGALPNKTFGDAPFQLTATASSGLAVAFASDNEDVVTVSGNTVTIVGTGTATITASQSGNGQYNAAASVPQQLTVANASQAITFGALPNKTYGDAAFQLTATASSGLTVSFASDNEDVATIDGNIVTIVGAGTANITASQAGDSEYGAATPVVRQLTIDKASQAIDFGAIATKTLNENSFTIAATATSALDVSFSSTSDKITIESGTVTLIKAGKASIKAEQNGNSNYLPAASIEQTFCINPVKPVISETKSANSVTLTSSNTAGNQWYKNGQVISGATSRDYAPTQDGRYTVQTTVEECASEVSEFVDVAFTGLNEPLSNNIAVYPNPVRDEVYIEISNNDGGKAVVALLDVTGRIVENRSIEANGTSRFDTSSLPRGMYFFRVHTQSRTTTHRFIRE